MACRVAARPLADGRHQILSVTFNSTRNIFKLRCNILEAMLHNGCAILGSSLHRLYNFSNEIIIHALNSIHMDDNNNKPCNKP